MTEKFTELNVINILCHMLFFDMTDFLNISRVIKWTTPNFLINLYQMGIQDLNPYIMVHPFGLNSGVKGLVVC
jgi:hypothetical protein